MSLPWYIPLTKIFFMSISNYYVVTKITNKKIQNKVLLLISCLVVGVIYTCIRNQTSILVAYPIYYIIFSITYSTYSNTEIQRGVFLSTITNAISIIALITASIISFLFMKINKLNMTKYSLIEYFIIGIVQITLIYLFFKIKRFKFGIAFMNNKMQKNILKIIGMFISIIILIVYTIYFIYSNVRIETIFFILFVIGAFLMIYWIKKSITKYYKEKMKERTVEIQQEQIKQQDEKIKNLQTELADVLQINHKYSHRISAMEKTVTKLGTKLQANEEFAEEYGDILSSIKKLSKEYKEEVASVIKETKLPKTNIFSIDNLLEYMKQESEKDKIDFELNLDFDISEILETKIPQSKLETMIADHIRDAIIAINCSDNKKRKIKVVLDKEDNNYQIKFYDTGIEFEIETLSKLGLKRATTHKSTGGSGIGFMTTFETLKQCKASLIIEEYSDLEYTKAVIIKFDNKNEYRIHSYRAEEIKNKIKDNRIIIE